MANNLFPGAASDSVLMVWDYCIARKLDPLKKPCHIVPMQVKDARSGDYIWRDVVMPGIYEYRITATRTGLYLGHAKAVYGPRVDYLGVMVPEFCEFVVYRWNKEAGMRAEYPVEIRFTECAATRKDKKTGDIWLNDRWSKAPQQMLTKCAEAAALREAFPDELGGTHTVEEMEGQLMLDPINVTSGRAPDPRGDLSSVDYLIRDKHVSAIADLIAEYGSDATQAAEKFREYLDAERMDELQELWISVHDKLAADGIISKQTIKKYKAAPAGGVADRGATHTS